MNKNIIIIDDTPDNIKVASLILNKEGFSVYSALSVKQAFKIMQKHKMSLVLMDAMMPDIDGFEGVELIREFRSFRCIPVLMVTALSEKEDVVKAIKSGADDYLTKPYNTCDLVDKVKSLTKISAFIERWCYR